MKKVILHLVSESSGRTVKYAAKSILSQFADIKAKEYTWPLIKNKESLNLILEKIKKKPGVVLYTISNSELRDILKDFCRDLKIPCVSVIGKIIKEVSAFWRIAPMDGALPYQLDENYFDKVNAIDYTLRHDDGQSPHELDEADIILIGPSRTSKTPTSVYLAYDGFKTANVPYIHGLKITDYLKKANNNTLIVGLIINPARLIEIRKSRLKLMQLNEPTNYIDLKVIQEECLQVRQICQENNWPIIDVSRRSIEETAAEITRLYFNLRKRKGR